MSHGAGGAAAAAVLPSSAITIKAPPQRPLTRCVKYCSMGLLRWGADLLVSEHPGQEQRDERRCNECDKSVCLHECLLESRPVSSAGWTVRVVCNRCVTHPSERSFK